MSRSTVVTVCFNSSAVLKNLLASIPPGTTTILVDNGSGDSAATRELADSYQAHLITNTNNSGFGSACNQGAALSRSEFLFFVNPDSTLNATTIAQLESAADAHPEASAFNPRIVNQRGAPAFKRRSCLLKPEQILQRKPPAHASEVPVLSGAALFVRAGAFDQVGGFDGNIFLYHEDDDISVRLRQQVGPIWFIPTAEVMHLSGHSSGRSAKVSALKAWHMGRSLVYTTTKHHIHGAYRKALWSAIRQLLSPSTLLSKRKFYKNRAFLQGVLSARQDHGAGYKPAP
ncbi:glycosyltransferase family 2 protein [Cyanobium sp. FACHB-13342]|uniref:glycosyltransferase family 2 protein n=1 Tax=Cyanobium sp. FACHB-13342 TaxID=2692793 RepID=UPI001680B086|nr:glycosyltransferase family 2 protein [Cyanobium sp. FACHB-13342]MBD2424069.1 glycosyltransferase family 2 protein [Cyanobium sp. FACHB-13342]